MPSTASSAYDDYSNNCNLVQVLVAGGALGHSIDDFLIPELNYRLQDYTCLATPRKILAAGGALLDGTGEGILQVVITDNYGNDHIVRIQILAEPTVGRNLVSAKTATRKSIVSILTAKTFSWKHLVSPCHVGEITMVCTIGSLTFARMAIEQRSWH